MDIVQRAKNICLTPNSEWDVIAAEPTATGGLITGYVIPLAAIGAVAGFVGKSIVGVSLGFLGSYRVPMVSGLVGMVVTLVMAVVGVFVLSLIVDALAPTFGGVKNSTQALKVVAYSMTPSWLAGILLVLPLLGTLSILAGFYGLYLMYLGLPRLMKAPQDKAVAYTAVTVVCAIVVAVVLGAVTAAATGMGLLGAGAFGVPRTASSSSSVQFDKNSALGKLQDLGAKLDENNKKVEAAQKSGDQAGAAAAALNGLGLLVGGGKRYDSVGVEVLKPLVPAMFAGLPKTSGSVEKNGFGGFNVSTAKATYTDGQSKTVDLDITDSGGASGLVGLAGWAGGIEGEKEDDSSVERTGKVNGRLVHEKSSKVGGENEYSIVVGDRFVVNAQGHGVDVSQLKSAVGSLDLNKLESMKDAGEQK